MLGAREKVDAIAFDQITSVQLGKGVFSSTIKLRAYGYQEDIEAIPKDKAEKSGHSCPPSISCFFSIQKITPFLSGVLNFIRNY